MDPAEGLSVAVTPATARLIREKVEDGSYSSATEVVDAALRALQRDEEEHAERIATIEAGIKASLEDQRPGIPAEEVIRELKQRLAKLAGGEQHAPVVGCLRE